MPRPKSIKPLHPTSDVFDSTALKVDVTLSLENNYNKRKHHWEQLAENVAQIKNDIADLHRRYREEKSIEVKQDIRVLLEDKTSLLKQCDSLQDQTEFTYGLVKATQESKKETIVKEKDTDKEEKEV